MDLEGLPATCVEEVLVEVDEIVCYSRMNVVSRGWNAITHPAMLRWVRGKYKAMRWKQLWVGLRWERMFEIMRGHRGLPRPPPPIRYRIE